MARWSSSPHLTGALVCKDENVLEGKVRHHARSLFPRVMNLNSAYLTVCTFALLHLPRLGSRVWEAQAGYTGFFRTLQCRMLMLATSPLRCIWSKRHNASFLAPRPGFCTFMLSLNVVAILEARGFLRLLWRLSRKRLRPSFVSRNLNTIRRSSKWQPQLPKETGSALLHSRTGNGHVRQGRRSSEGRSTGTAVFCSNI